MQYLTHIPTVHLADYLSEDPGLKAQFIKALGDSFSTIGFAIVSGHGIDSVLIENTYLAFKNFFDLPDAVKMKYEIPGQAGQRGYTSKGKEHAKQSNVGDLKEFFHLGQIIDDEAGNSYAYPNNVYVEEIPEIALYGTALYRKLEHTGMHLLRAVAAYLHLDPMYFDEKIRNGNSILRPLHYFPIENPETIPPGAVRAAEHEDINLITLLLGASAEGLQVLTQQGHWIAAAPKPDELVINVGDMLQRLTNNKLKSTTHRVVNPPRESMHLPRYSMPFFLHPRPDISLTCLDTCIDTDHPKAYPDITAGEYLNERLREIGLK